MIPKLLDYMNELRAVLFLRKRKNTVYFQLQIDVAREDGLCAELYCEYEKVQEDDVEEIGKTAKRMILRFHDIADLSITEFQDLTGMSIEQYEIYKQEERMKFLEAKTSKEIDEKFEECGIDYDVKKNHYSISLSWIYHTGKKKWRDSSESIGEEGVFTFDYPLEFDDDVDPVSLGEMILEAFKRSKKMAEVTSRGPGTPKEIDMYDGMIVEVVSPKDKHFADYNDFGVSEIYQDYAYIAREGAKSSADFMLTIAPEIYGNLNCDNIRSSWTEAFGEADEISFIEKNYGIYNYRAEFKNKKMFRIAYFRDLNDGTYLECCMEITDPAKKKKLVEKLPALFEEFALECKIK